MLVGAGAYTNCDTGGRMNIGTTLDTELRYEGLFASAAFVRFNNGPVANFSSAERRDPALADTAGENDNFMSGLGNALGYGGRSACRGVVASATPDPRDPFTVPFGMAWGASMQLQYTLPAILFPVDDMALEVLARFDIIEPENPDDGTFTGGGSSSPYYVAPSSYASADNPPSQYRITFGVNWFPTFEQSLRLGVNYQLRRETERVMLPDVSLDEIRNDVFWIQATLAI